MAIFLLIYIIVCLVWLFWAAILTYLILRYQYPDKMGLVHLAIFWGVSLFIFLISIIFIARADWTTVPAVLSSTGAVI